MSDSINAKLTAAELIDKWASRVLPPVERLLNNIWSHVSADLRAYAKTAAHHYRTLRSFIDEHQTDLYEYYVPLDLVSNDLRMSEVSASKLFSRSKCSVITGNGGCGKSTLLRHLFISCLASK